MQTKIEWATKVWNPITGCNEGCTWCYARAFAHRMQNNPNAKIRHKYRNGFKPTFHNETLDEPKSWRNPQRVFIGSMGDLFDPEFTIGAFYKVMKVMSTYRQHTYMLLTKKPAIMLKYAEAWMKDNHTTALPDNIWCGVTITNQQQADDFIPVLINIKAKIRFVSIEPITGPVQLNKIIQLRRSPLLDLLLPKFFNYISNIDWVIVGGMTGPKSTPAHPLWIAAIRDTCIQFNKPFFFKGWGAYHTDWINLTNAKPVFKMFTTFQQWQQKLWVQPGDKLISISGQVPKCGSEIRDCQYPIAIMSPVKKGQHLRQIEEQEWNMIPTTT